MIEAGDWMQSKTNPEVLLEVISVAADQGVKVRMGDQTVNTSVRYLTRNYQPLSVA